MLGKNSVSEAEKGFIIFICFFIISMLSFAGLADAQTCEWPAENSDTFVIIDGTVYEYIDIEKSKERLKKIQEGETLKIKVRLLEDKLALKDEKLALKDDRILILQDSLSLSNEMIDKLFANGFHRNQKIPLLQKPAFNYTLGVITVGGLFALWRFADNGFQINGAQ